MATLYDGKGNVITVSSGTAAASPAKLNFTKTTHGVNHRGYNTAPENTLPAYRLSAEKGFSFVEADVRYTSDGVPVLLHESSLNHTARNADGTELAETIYIKDITYEEALAYDYGIWKSADYAGTKIPTLEEFLILCKKLSLHAYLDMKGGTAAQLEGVVEMVKAHGMEDWVSYIGSTTQLKIIVGLNKYARVGILDSGYGADNTATVISDAKSLMTGYNEVFIDYWYENGRTEPAAYFEAGLTMEFYTFSNTEKTALEAFSQHPYMVGWTADSVNIEDVLRSSGLSE